MKDPYSILGVPRNASADEIKRAHRKLAKQFHPDLNSGRGAEHRFQELAGAYDILGDSDKRKRFDRGEIDAQGRPAANFGFRPYGKSGRRHRAQTGHGGFRAQDIFDDLLRNAGSRFRSDGTDVAYRLEVSFEEAARGAKRRLRLSDGRVINVTVPAGTEDGQSLRLKGQGMPGMGGGKGGDALVEIRVASHPAFTRKGVNVHVEAPITLTEAVLGGSVKVPTLDGPVSLKVPAGSDGLTALRLKGRGVGGRQGARGDQIVRLRVILPDPPEPKLREFLKTWQPPPGYGRDRSS